jgi:hypothetical protein
LLLMDYIWRRRGNLTDYQFARYKQIYHVASVWSVGVHYCYSVNVGTKANWRLHPSSRFDNIHLQHYKLAHQGVFHKGEKRMIHSPDDLQQDTLLRDTYKADLLQRMGQLQ